MVYAIIDSNQCYHDQLANKNLFQLKCASKPHKIKVAEAIIETNTAAVTYP